nr:hypothetical protein [Tanacetum cinerariifolium]
MGIFVNGGPEETGIKDLFGGEVSTMISPRGSIVASFENVESFSAVHTPPDHLIRIDFKQKGVVPKVVFYVFKKLVFLLGRHSLNNKVTRVTAPMAKSLALHISSNGRSQFGAIKIGASYLVHQSLAVSRRHVAASYWIAASDVAATSSPATVGQRRSTPPDNGQRWRSTTVAGGEPPLTVAGPPLTTTGPLVNGGWWAGQRAVRARSGSGPPRGMPRVSHVCPRGIHVAADVDNQHKVWIEHGTCWLES